MCTRHIGGDTRIGVKPHDREEGVASHWLGYILVGCMGRQKVVSISLDVCKVASGFLDVQTAMSVSLGVCTAVSKSLGVHTVVSKSRVIMYCCVNLLV